MNTPEYFDADGELTETGLKAYVEAMRTRSLDQLPEDVYTYVQNRTDVLNQILSRFEAQTPPIPTPSILSTGRWIRAAAAITVLALFGAAVWMLTLRHEPAGRPPLATPPKADSTPMPTPDNSQPEVSPPAQPAERPPVLTQAEKMARIRQAAPQAFIFDETHPGAMMAAEPPAEVLLEPVSDSVQVNTLKYIWRTDVAEAQFRLLDRRRLPIGAVSRLRTVTSANGQLAFSLTDEEAAQLSSGGYYIAAYAGGRAVGYYKVWYYRID